jgi:hypothetical protein
MRRAKQGTGKTVSMMIDFWLDSEDDQTIHIGTNDPDLGAENFRFSVTAVVGRSNSHPLMYKQLAKCLRSKGAPAPKMET